MINFLEYISLNTIKKYCLLSSLFFFCLSGTLRSQDGDPNQDDAYIEMLEKKKILSDSSTSDSLKFIILIELSFYFEPMSLDSALYYVEKSYVIAKQLSSVELNKACGDLAALYMNKGDYENAQKYLDTSLIIITENNLQNCKTSFYNQQAIVYYYLSKQQKSLTAYQKALDYSFIENKSFTRTSILNNIGNVFSSEFNYEKAIEYYNRGLEDCDNNGHSKITAFNGLGLCYMGLRDDYAANFYFNEALYYSRAESNTRQEAYTLNYIGLLYTRQNEIDSSLLYLNQSLGLYKRINDPGGKARVYNDLGKVYFAIEKYDLAISICQKALKIQIQNGSLGAQSDNCKCLYDAYKKKEDDKKALLYHEKWKILQDSLYSISNIKEITTIELNYDHQKEKEILAIQQNQKEEQLAAETKLAYIIMFSIGLISLFLLGFFINSRRKNKLIAIQNTQLKTLNNTKDYIFGMIGHDLRKPAIAFRGITKKVNYLLKNKEYDTLSKLGSEIERDAISLNNLTDSLLGWALAQKNVLPYNPDTINLQEIISEVEELFNRIIVDKKISISTHIPNDLTVYADRSSLLTIFRNLIDNALKFTEINGSITINAHETDQGINVNVTDTGRGMTDEFIKDIFLLKTGKSTQGTMGEKGTGLGLYLVKELINLNKGIIKVKSEFNVGSQFELLLPTS